MEMIFPCASLKQKVSELLGFMRLVYNGGTRLSHPIFMRFTITQEVCLNDKKAGNIRTSLASAGEAGDQASIKTDVGWRGGG